jgi:hypothetical protein
VFVAFDVLGLAQRARLDNAAILVSDSWSYRTHVTRDNRDGEIVVAIDGTGARPMRPRPGRTGSRRRGRHGGRAARRAFVTFAPTGP